MKESKPAINLRSLRGVAHQAITITTNNSNFASEPRRGAGEAEGEGGRWVQKNWAPRSIVFSSRYARARVSQSCKRALPCSGKRCVCAKVSLVSAGAPRHGSALPAWTGLLRQLYSTWRITPGLFRVARCLCFWRALGQSAQAEQDTLILCSKNPSF